jgi:pyruvate dehydrogenase E2 component (dihydrolipoamide acetyltransferase)
MAREFLLPDPGEGIHEADILEVHVSAGDEVKDGDPLFSVETDKAVVDIPASFDGQIEEVRVQAGDVVEVGSVLLTFTEPHEPTSTQATEREPTPTDEEEAVKDEPEGEPEPEEEPEPEDETEPEEELEPADETKADDRAQPDRDTVSRGRPVPASPATRSLAKKLGVDLSEIEGSGPEGRIEPSDVQAAAEEGEEPSREAVAAAEAGHVEVEWVDLRGVRKATARHMAQSWQEIPHVTHHDVADITDLERLRVDQAAEIEKEGGRLSLTVFLVKAVSAALADHPRFNATVDVDNERLGLKKSINIGVAVDTEDGLVVPVINDADEKSIAEIAIELPALAERMREGDRSLEDLKGGTFTVTNPGGIGGTSFNPIINHPEVAILGAARAREMPVIVTGGRGDGEEPAIEARLHLPLVLAFDHRVNDGADAARFMNAIKDLLEDPGRLALRI